MIDFPGFCLRFVLFGAMALLLVIISFFFSDDLCSFHNIYWCQFLEFFIKKFNNHILSRDLEVIDVLSCNLACSVVNWS